MNNNDVELNALLGIDSEDNTTPEPRLENSAEVDSSVTADNATNDESSKRENDRVRTAVERANKAEEELKTLKQSQNKEQDLEGFLSQINDDSTRTLLKEYGKVMRADIEKQYQPAMSTFKEERFEKEFAQFAEKLPNLSLHKEELKKEFTRNPNAELKSLIGSRVVDILSSKIVPLETRGAQSPRDEVTANLDVASKEDLYAMLKAKKN